MHHPCDENGRKILKTLSAPKKETDLCPFLSASHILPQSVGRSVLRPARHHSDRASPSRSGQKGSRRRMERQSPSSNSSIWRTSQEIDRLLPLPKRLNASCTHDGHKLVDGNEAQPRQQALPMGSAFVIYARSMRHGIAERPHLSSTAKNLAETHGGCRSDALTTSRPYAPSCWPRSPERPCPRISRWRHECLHRYPAGISVF